MRSINAYDVVKSVLKSLSEAEGYYFVEPVLEDGQQVSLFPIITMENVSSTQEHGERGRQESVEILIMYAVRGRSMDVVETMNTMEGKIKTELYKDTTLSDNVKFFDVSVMSRDYRSGQSGVVVAWGEISLTCVAVGGAG